MLKTAPETTYRLKVESYNTSTSSGISVVTLYIKIRISAPSMPSFPGGAEAPVIPDKILNRTYTFKYIWTERRPDISQFKQYKNKPVEITVEKPRKPSMYIKFNPKDYLLGNPQVDLYGKRGKYIGSCKEMSSYLIKTYGINKPLTLYIKE